MFTLKIKTNNAAFDDNRGGEMARILRELADKLDSELSDHADHKGTVRDVNGNLVGEYRLTSL